MCDQSRHTAFLSLTTTSPDALKWKCYRTESIPFRERGSKRAENSINGHIPSHLLPRRPLLPKPASTSTPAPTTQTIPPVLRARKRLVIGKKTTIHLTFTTKSAANGVLGRACAAGLNTTSQSAEGLCHQSLLPCPF